MAVKNDLTFAELAASLPTGAITFANGQISINVKTITDDNYAALTDAGVVKFFYLLRAAAGSAQDTVNAALVDGDVPLQAFPEFSYGVPSPDGNIPVSQSVEAFLTVSTNVVKGKTA